MRLIPPPGPQGNFPRALPISPIDPVLMLLWALHQITYGVFLFLMRISPHSNFLQRPWQIVLKLSRCGEILALVRFLYQYTRDIFYMLWRLPWAILCENFRRLSCLVHHPHELVP